MQKDQRLLDLAALLLKAAEPVSWREIQEQFPEDYAGTGEAAIRKFERDKADLLELGIPVRYVAGDEDLPAGYVIDKDEFYLPDLKLPTGRRDVTSGPVQALIPCDDEAEAVAIANGTAFGLVAGVWTRDGSRALRLARRLQCGQVFVNNYGAGGGIELPFGGVKASGHGREKGFEALYGFSTLKTVAILHG